MTFEYTQYHRLKHFQTMNYMVCDTQINEAELIIRSYQSMMQSRGRRQQAVGAAESSHLHSKSESRES